MRRIVLIALIFISLGQLNAVGQKSNDRVLLTIAGNDVKVSEFEAIYKKNNNNETIDPKSTEEYLDLYINFKLKVQEAMDMGLDTAGKFRKELEGYRTQLAKPYLSDKEVTERLIDEVYERMQQEVRASHILLSVSPEASPSDTLEIYNKIIDLRKQAMDGASFDELARSNSSDPSAKDNSGDLGYFSAMYMVYPFENRAYETNVGEISMPVRTRYGYHIIKVTDKRPARGEITAAHIMVKLNPASTEAQINDAKKKIDEILVKARNGEDFGKLAKEFSDDKGSSRKGGMLQPFKAGRMILEFEEAAFALEKDNEISDPVRTQYGWHIIKRIEKKDLPKLEDIRLDLKEKISRDTRSNKSRNSMLKKIKENYGFKEKIEERNDFYAVIDTSLFKAQWETSKAKGLDKVMFKLGKEEYTQQDFAQHIFEKQRMGKVVDVKYIVDLLYEDFVQTVCFDYEDRQLESKYPEFKLLMQEYHDGILLFDLTDQKVWSKAVKDTTGLESFFEKNNDNYRWGERLEAIVYSCSSKEIAKKTKELAEKRAKGELTTDSLKKMINVDSQLNLTVEESKFSKGDNEAIDNIKWEKGMTSVMEMNGRFVFIDVIEKLKPTYKELKEVRGLVTSDYQNYLEKEWIKELREKYPVTVDKEVLKQIK